MTTDRPTIHLKARVSWSELLSALSAAVLSDCPQVTSRHVSQYDADVLRQAAKSVQEMVDYAIRCRAPAPPA